MKSVDYIVDLKTLERRMDLLEGRVMNSLGRLHGPQPLMRVYSEILLSGITPSKELETYMNAIVLLLSPRTLLDLCRLTHDMFAWRPFLAALDHLDTAGYEVRDATKWLEGCIRELLDAQGLRYLQIEDVVGSTHEGIERLRQICLSKQ